VTTASTSQSGSQFEPLPLSLLNDFLYCHRRSALKLLEGWRESNAHTILGELAHEHADLPGYELSKGVLLWRALPVWSERLGLSGKCDIVEAHRELSPTNGFPYVLCPVEYKKGKRRQFENDDAQLCAQALCLEEMFGRPISAGAVFHATSKRRREVLFTQELRQCTENFIFELHAMAKENMVPPARFKPACEECSLFDVCLPKATSASDRASRLAKVIFEVD